MYVNVIINQYSLLSKIKNKETQGKRYKIKIINNILYIKSTVYCSILRERESKVGQN